MYPCVEIALIHHLLANHEWYVEVPGIGKPVKLPEVRPESSKDHGEMIQLLTQAGYVMWKLNVAWIFEAKEGRSVRVDALHIQGAIFISAAIS